MRYASVCDGIGAAHVAWRHLGWECAWTSEIEPFPATVVDHHFAFKNVGDMTKITEEMLDELGPVELLVGGTPCQSFSVAGLRGGLDDPRGNLALRFVQLASVLKPEWIVWENVPGVLSSGKGRDFGTFLGALGELGYGFAYRVLDAQWFGVAQRRRRVFVVAHAGDWRRAAAVLFERESVFGNPPSRGKAGKGITRATTASLTSIGRGVERCGESRGQDDVVLAAPQAVDFQNCAMIGSKCGSLQASGMQKQSRGFGVIAFHPTQDPISSTDGSTHAIACGSKGGCCTLAVAAPIDLRQTSRGDKETNRRATGSGGPPGHGIGHAGDPAYTVSERGQAVAFDTYNQSFSDVTHTLRNPNGTFGDAVPAVAFDAYNQACAEVTHTLRKGRSATGDEIPQALVGMVVRRLTPRECERLQGFPDDYTLVTYRNKPAADGPRYKALGNSMAVPVMRWIGERIAMVSQLKEEVANVVD